MKKLLFVALTGALVAAMSLPAAAVETKVGGYFRSRGIIADTYRTKDAKPDKLYDQRFRAKVDMSLNEYVSIVYYGEVDFQYGDAGYGLGGGKTADGKTNWNTRNDGGGLAGDTVNMETKNLYAAFKIPETQVGLTVGLQGAADSFDSILFNADMAGIEADGTFGAAKVSLGTYKWQEGGFTGEDDIDLYTLKVKFSPMEGTKLGADAYWLNSQQGNDGSNASSAPKGDYTYLGINGSTKVAMADLSGWFLYNMGTNESGAEDVDVAGWGLSLKGAATFDKVKVALRGMYFSGDDDDTDKDSDTIMLPAAPADAFQMYDAGMMLMLADVYGNTYFQNGLAWDDAMRKGFGLWGLAAKASTEFQGFNAQCAVGYFGAVEDDRKTETTKREGTSIGTEINLRVGKKIAGAVDVSLNGAYAFLGDFYDKTAADGDDPDAQYMAYLMVNIPY
ncbi:MAG: hypothetical protein P1P84_17610 [Deferrisomatales bacterium]|nr:hypothetical protein [Deferrisomatales bacterium]